MIAISEKFKQVETLHLRGPKPPISEPKKGTRLSPVKEAVIKVLGIDAPPERQLAWEITIAWGRMAAPRPHILAKRFGIAERQFKPFLDISLDEENAVETWEKIHEAMRKGKKTMEQRKKPVRCQQNDEELAKLRNAGLSNSEIAERLGVSIQTIKNRFSIMLKENSFGICRLRPGRKTSIREYIA